MKSLFHTTAKKKKKIPKQSVVTPNVGFVSLIVVFCSLQYFVYVETLNFIEAVVKCVF